MTSSQKVSFYRWSQGSPKIFSLRSIQPFLRDARTDLHMVNYSKMSSFRTKCSRFYAVWIPRKWAESKQLNEVHVAIYWLYGNVNRHHGAVLCTCLCKHGGMKKLNLVEIIAKLIEFVQSSDKFKFATHLRLIKWTNCRVFYCVHCILLFLYFVVAIWPENKKNWFGILQMELKRDGRTRFDGDRWWNRWSRNEGRVMIYLTWSRWI